MKVGTGFLSADVNLSKKNPYSKALTFLSQLWKVSVDYTIVLRDADGFLVTDESVHCFAASSKLEQ